MTRAMISRRALLRRATALGATGALTTLGLNHPVLAQSAANASISRKT